MKNLIIAIIIIWASLLAGCTPKRNEIQTFWGQTHTQALISSQLHANAIGGIAYRVAPTGSMRPTLEADDFIVVKPIPYKDVQQGMAANYQARWLPPTDQTVTHWVSKKFGDEWIMDGEANSSYEKSANMRMGEKEFRGQVIAIYTTREKK